MNRYRTAGIRRAAMVYWVVIFTLTHIPARELPAAFPHADKIAHFALYLGLGFLVPVAFDWRRSVLLRGVLLLAGYGLFDELTQPFFERSFEWLDWVADLAGIAVGVLLSIGLRSAKEESS